MTDTVDDTINSISSKSTDEIAVGKENLMETEAVESNDTVPPPANDKLRTSADSEAVSLPTSATTNNKRFLEEEVAEAAEKSVVEEPPSPDAAAAAATDEDASRTTKIDIHRPVKRARTAYFIFADERRAEIQKQVSFVSVAPRFGTSVVVYTLVDS